MIDKKAMTRTLVVAPALAAILGVGILAGCVGNNGTGEGRDSGGATATQEISRGQNPGEHGPGGESGSEAGDPAAKRRAAPPWLRARHSMRSAPARG